eukprot:GHVR01145548.1.p2 GENE.GHVR01145548.1~~GHVR01145548.1.p2  ORF type:complete len:166 (+),score=10.91 GHVR01145548.1:214-711(+)
MNLTTYNERYSSLLLVTKTLLPQTNAFLGWANFVESAVHVCLFRWHICFFQDGTPIVSWKRSASVEGEMTFSIQQSYAARMLVFCFGSEDVYRATTESTKPGTDDNISRVCRMPPAIPVCGRSDCVCLNHVRAPGKDNKARSTADTVQLTTEGSDHLEYSASISC